MPTFCKRTRVPVSAEQLFAWHARPGAFERLTPPWDRVRLLEHEGIEDGDRAVLELRKGPLRRRWVAIHRDLVPGRQFADDQESGPFAEWRHTHRFIPDGADASWLEDEVQYRLPFGPAGSVAAGRYTERTLERTFAFRHRQTLDDLMRHDPARAPLRVAITGASGLIGAALGAFLSAGGHQVSRLVRREPHGEGDVRWDPVRGEIDMPALEGVDVVCHLAGESIDGRWSDRKKAAILESRRSSTRLIAEAVGRLERKPRALVCASAVGYYGDRGDEILTEESAAGSGFLADVVKVWEQSADPARDAGIRVVHLRQGVILESILPRLTTPFKLGLGGVVGSGRQYWSWISLDDVVGAWNEAIRNESLAGAVNVTAPAPVRNSEFTKTLGRVLRRPTVVPLPARAARSMLGELADALLLASQRVEPERLEAAGFRFLHPQLEEALRHRLGR